MRHIARIVYIVLSFFGFIAPAEAKQPTRTSAKYEQTSATSNKIPLRRCDRMCVNTNGHWLKTSLRSR